MIVVLLPDSGRGYLTKVFNDDWLAQYGFPVDDVDADVQTVGEVLRGKDGRLPDLVHTHPGETIAEAVAILQEYGVSQMPVVRAEPPVVAAEVVGSVSERTLLDLLFAGAARLTDSVERAHVAAAARRSARPSRPSEAVDALEGADAAARPRGRQAGRRASPGTTCWPTWPAAEACGFHRLTASSRATRRRAPACRAGFSGRPVSPAHSRLAYSENTF